MKISEEKEYLYRMMVDTMAERRKLTEIYYSLQKRMDDLIALETKGMDEIPIESIVDIHNTRDTKRVVENIQKVAEHTIKRVEKETEEKINPPKKEVIPKKEIELEKEKVAKQSPTSGKGTLSVDKAAGMIAQVLNEYGRPMPVSDLYEAVNNISEIPITRKNFRNNILPRSMRVNRSIDNISRGFYQYLR